MIPTSVRAVLPATSMLCGVLMLAASAPLQAQSHPPERAIRRDIPMTNTIRRAFATGTRDSSGRPGSKYWQLRTDYTINVRVDPETSRLTGKETISLHNNSPDSLKELVFRLDQNIMRGMAPRNPGWQPAENTDECVITKMTVNGQSVNLAPPTGQYGEPTGTTGAYATGLTSTVAHVRLAQQIMPHSEASVEVEWNVKMPGGQGSGHRSTMRWADTLYQPAQWYPRLAVYDDLRGWNGENYLGPSEFYNNFGRFDVSMDVPGGWIVSGTGVLQNPKDVLTSTAQERLSHVLESDSMITVVGPDEIGPGKATANGDRLVWHYVADTVNDFAWATAKKYVWQVTRATIPGKGPVQIHMVFLPGRADRFEKAGPIARHALEFYSKLWFPYAFPKLTLQDGPNNGMEYPMVINSSAGPADHETAHQWWPMTVSNNETVYGWMDEGFNQFMNIFSDADAAGKPASLNRVGQGYGNISGDETEPPMMWNANYGGPMYGYTTYGKAPPMLSMLGGVVGDSAMLRAHAEWAKTWMFKHPSPWDYMFFMSKALNRDLGWFWYYWLFTTESVDGSIESVTTNNNGATVVVHQAGQMPSPVVLEVHFASDGPAIQPMKNAQMIDANTAIVTWPVDVWFDGSKTFKAELTFGSRKIEKITLDPNGRFPDHDTKDNVWPR